MCPPEATQAISECIKNFIALRAPFCAREVRRVICTDESKLLLAHREVAVEIYKLFQNGGFPSDWIGQVVCADHTKFGKVHYVVYRRSNLRLDDKDSENALLTSATRVTCFAGVARWSYYGDSPVVISTILHNDMVRLWVDWQDGKFPLNVVVHHVGDNILFRPLNVDYAQRQMKRLRELTFLEE